MLLQTKNVVNAMISDNYLVWIDLEMTGLNPQQDLILEIATIITNNDLEIIAEGPALVIQAPSTRLDAMDNWCKEHHAASGLLERVYNSSITTQQAEQETTAFLKQHCKPKTAPLCGNSVYVDRAFLRNHMPQVDDFLHYRIIDVSSIKEVVYRWYGKNQNTEFKKQEKHRSVDDIRESIAELIFFRSKFFL